MKTLKSLTGREGADFHLIPLDPNLIVSPFNNSLLSEKKGKELDIPKKKAKLDGEDVEDALDGEGDEDDQQEGDAGENDGGEEEPKE